MRVPDLAMPPPEVRTEEQITLLNADYGIGVGQGQVIISFLLSPRRVILVPMDGLSALKFARQVAEAAKEIGAAESHRPKDA